MTFRALPTYEQPLETTGRTSSVYYRWFDDIDKGTAPSAEASITVTASPFTYTAPRKGNVIVNGGTVSQIKFSRTTGVSYVIGVTAGMFNLDFGDSLIVTYSGKPTMTFVPT